MFLVDFLERISKWNVIVALSVALIALALTILARPAVSKWFPRKTEEEREKLALRIKIVCAAVMVAACILSVAF